MQYFDILAPYVNVICFELSIVEEEPITAYQLSISGSLLISINLLDVSNSNIEFTLKHIPTQLVTLSIGMAREGGEKMTSATLQLLGRMFGPGTVVGQRRFPEFRFLIFKEVELEELENLDGGGGVLLLLTGEGIHFNFDESDDVSEYIG